MCVIAFLSLLGIVFGILGTLMYYSVAPDPSKSTTIPAMTSSVVVLSLFVLITILVMK